MSKRKFKRCEMHIQSEREYCQQLQEAEMARQVIHEQDVQNLEGLVEHFEDEHRSGTP